MSEDSPQPTKRRSLLLGCLVLPIVGLGGCVLILSESKPKGQQGSGAEALAAKMQQAVAHKHWSQSLALEWTFRGAHKHLWDRERQLAQVAWDDLRVQVDLADSSEPRRGRAFRDDKLLPESEARPLIDKAYSDFCNDSFWLNPIAKLYDTGVERRLVEDDGRQSLLISYAQGGVTPGDAYLWQVNDEGLPTAYKMWVQIIPIGGLRATWEDWITLETGLKVSTRHQIGPWGLFTLKLEDIHAAKDIKGLRKQDPFAGFAEGSAESAPKAAAKPSSRPSSKPSSRPAAKGQSK